MMNHVIVAATFVSVSLLSACASSPFLDLGRLPATNQREMLTKTAADDTTRKTKKLPAVSAKLVTGGIVTSQTSGISGPPSGVKLAGDSSAARGMFNAPDRGSTPVV